jgi:hypothetical protein
MSFWKKLFGTGSESLEFDPEEVKAQNEQEIDFLNLMRSYHDQKKYEVALSELLSFLGDHPTREHFALFTASTILRSYLQDRATNTVSEIAYPIMADSRLDRVFMSCASCHACWVPAPMSRGSFYSHRHSLNLSQINVCPKCGAKSIQAGRQRNNS